MALKILNKTQPELGVVANTYNPSTWELEEGRSEVQGQSILANLERRKFEVSRVLSPPPK